MPYALLKILCKDKMLSRFFENAVLYQQCKTYIQIMNYITKKPVSAADFLATFFIWNEDKEYHNYWSDLYDKFIYGLI